MCSSELFSNQVHTPRKNHGCAFRCPFNITASTYAVTANVLALTMEPRIMGETASKDALNALSKVPASFNSNGKCFFSDLVARIAAGLPSDFERIIDFKSFQTIRLVEATALATLILSSTDGSSETLYASTFGTRFNAVCYSLEGIAEKLKYVGHHDKHLSASQDVARIKDIYERTLEILKTPRYVIINKILEIFEGQYQKQTFISMLLQMIKRFTRSDEIDKLISQLSNVYANMDYIGLVKSIAVGYKLNSNKVANRLFFAHPFVQWQEDMSQMTVQQWHALSFATQHRFCLKIIVVIGVCETQCHSMQK